MNILPLIFAFLLIFSYISSSFMQKNQHKKDLIFSIKGSWNVYRKLDNELQKRDYKKLQGKKEKVKPSPPRDLALKEEKEFRSPRLSCNYYEEAKLSLFPITQSISLQQTLYMKKVLKNLLLFSYQGTAIEKEIKRDSILDQLVEAIFLAVKESEEGSVLANLKIEDRDLSILFYKMCKGTASYALKKGGYPSLCYFVNLEDFGKDYCLNFSMASKPVLDAFFSKEMADMIIEKEEEKWQMNHRNMPLSFAELMQVFTQNSHSSMDRATFESMICFDKKQKGGATIRVLDRHSKAFCEVLVKDETESFFYRSPSSEEE